MESRRWADRRAGDTRVAAADGGPDDNPLAELGMRVIERARRAARRELARREVDPAGAAGPALRFAPADGPALRGGASPGSGGPRRRTRGGTT